MKRAGPSGEGGIEEGDAALPGAPPSKKQHSSAAAGDAPSSSSSNTTLALSQAKGGGGSSGGASDNAGALVTIQRSSGLHAPTMKLEGHQASHHPF